MLTGNTFIFYQNGESAHLVITLSNVYILILMYFFMLSETGFEGDYLYDKGIKSKSLLRKEERRCR